MNLERFILWLRGGRPLVLANAPRGHHPVEETDMDNDEKETELGRLFLWLAVAGIMILILAGCTSQEARQAHQDGQVEIIRTQVDARTQQRIADATARTALYEAMARVAQTNPESSDAIAVALAVSSVREEDDGQVGPLVQLQAQKNEAIELAKAIAPALITTAGTLGVTAIQGDVNKTQARSAARVAIADSASDADIMRSVTNMATTGFANSGIDVSGDYYDAGGDIDQSVITNETTTATTTSTTIQDSYNPTSSSDTYTTSNTYNQQTYQTASGDSLTFDELRDLVLQGLNFTVIIDGEEVTVEPSEPGACPDGGGLTFGAGSVVCG